jgi:hypothetical protein
VLFFLAMPSLIATTAGKVFSLLWLSVALASLAALTSKVFQRKRKGRVGGSLAEKRHEHAVSNVVYRRKQRSVFY